jgi:hypothetical protein
MFCGVLLVMFITDQYEQKKTADSVNHQYQISVKFIE